VPHTLVARNQEARAVKICSHVPKNDLAKALAVAMAVGLGLAPACSPASTVTLDLGSEVNGVEILNYFNGGADGHGAVGPSDGVLFSSTAVQDLAGTTEGKFENAPSAGVLYVTYSSSVAGVMNVASGFSALSLAYSLLNNSSTYASTIDLYSGLNGTGSVVGTLTLSPASTTVSCTAHGDEFCTWQTATANMTGIAESVVFANTAATANEGQEFDALQISEVPLPGRRCCSRVDSAVSPCWRGRAACRWRRLPADGRAETGGS